MTSAEIADLARAAGRAGRGWMEWTAEDVVQDHVLEYGADSDAWEAAYREGRLAHLVADRGYLERYTTAPDDYDTFGTESVEQVGEWHGQKLRRVLIDPRHSTYQSDRYASGLHGCWERDPHVEDRERSERLERNRLERERAEAARVAGIAWLERLSDDELEAAIDSEDLETHGIEYADARRVRKERAEAARKRATEAEFTRCLAMVPEGAILVDDGAPAKRGRWGVIPGRPAYVYYNVRIDGAYSRDADVATVMSASSGAELGGLAYVAQWLAEGRLRRVEASDVPPAAVTSRIGHERWRDIVRVEAAGRVVWAHRGWDLVVLDERGRKVRAKAVLEAVRAKV